MKRYLALLPVLLALVLVAGLRLVAGAGHPNDGPVYSVAQLRDNLRLDPRAWVGRTVLVRGVAAACLASTSPPFFLSCNHWPPDLFDPGPAGASASLPLAWGSQDPLPAFLRGLPLVGQLLPRPVVPRWDAAATYRVQLRAMPAGLCGTTPCYAAVLLDAAPGVPEG